MKKIVILGSTGSIGTQTLEIIKQYPGEFKVIGLSTFRNEELLKKQAEEFKVRHLAVGEKDLVKLATLPEADTIVVAVVGLSGFLPTLEAVRRGKNICLATKEVLVLAGELVMAEVKKHKANLTPIDSEHSAIFQSLKAGKQEEIRNLILTMGKGPIARMSKEELGKVTMKDVSNRPAWKMGLKISVDSATGINKAFEVIEAKHIFNVKPEQIKIVVHPEYLCHSLVEFIDGSIITEIGVPDMRRYIQYALFYPQRKKAMITSFTDIVGKTISFEPPPYEKFPCLTLGFRAIESAGTMPAVVHGADTVAVSAFVDGQIGFLDIHKVIKSTMEKHKLIDKPDLEEILNAEKWAQEFAQKIIRNKI